VIRIVVPSATARSDVPGDTGDNAGSAGIATNPETAPVVAPLFVSPFVCTSPTTALLARSTESARTLPLTTAWAKTASS
jgi:hypothetical protein